ncbi:MAG: hypothetical protein IMZ53_15350 [Thermoplasmata archaeon]|nr:hypothetical protein [Thermoplasmata archaeon]
MKSLMPHPLFKIGRATLQSMMWLIWIIRLALLGIVVFAIVAVCSYSFQGDKTPPIEDAPYSVVAVIQNDLGETITHVYYANLIMDKGTQYVMVDYWTFDGKRYNLTKGEKYLIKKDWSRIGIYRRTE